MHLKVAIAVNSLCKPPIIWLPDKVRIKEFQKYLIGTFYRKGLRGEISLPDCKQAPKAASSFRDTRWKNLANLFLYSSLFSAILFGRIFSFFRLIFYCIKNIN